MVLAHPQKRVQCSILHELGDNHHWSTLGDHTFQTDNVGVVKLAHDRSLRQEVSPLPVSVAHFKSLDGYDDLSAARQLEATAANLPKLSCESPGETARKTAKGQRERQRERRGRGERNDGRVEESGGKEGRGDS